MVTAEQYRLSNAIKNYISKGGMSEIQAEDILKGMDYHWKVRCLFDITADVFFRETLMSKCMDCRLLWAIRKLIFMIKTDEYSRLPKWSESFMEFLKKKW